MQKIISFEQLAEHNSLKKCWILIHGKVYDVTNFLDEHPGGDDVILSATGKDATDDFEDVGHSEDARSMLKDFYVGDIDLSTVPESTPYKPPVVPIYNQDKSSLSYGRILQFVLPIAVFVGAITLHFYTKSSPA